MRYDLLTGFTRAANFERLLRTLRPGDALDVRPEEWLDIQVPANPLDRQSPEYLAEWFRVRMPFKCEVRHHLLPEKWTFFRPQMAAHSIIHDEKEPTSMHQPNHDDERDPSSKK